jgi:hypothetical protein
MNAFERASVGTGLAAESTIVYADLGLAVPQLPSAVAQTIAQQAKDSLVAGQFNVVLEPLTVADVRDAIGAMPSGHERLSLDRRLILLDAGAMLAYAPYRACVLLTGDPFSNLEATAQALGLDVSALRIRIHDALLAAERVVSLSGAAFDAVVPLLASVPDDRMFPPIPLKAATTENAPILVIGNDDDMALREMLTLLDESLPTQEFYAFDPMSVFAQPWRAVLHLGLARSSLPGARLSDAWAGGVPVVQLVEQSALTARSRRGPDSAAEIAVTHGRSGLRFSSVDEFVGAMQDLLQDPLPLRSVARAARRAIDPAAQWDQLLKAVLQ